MRAFVNNIDHIAVDDNQSLLQFLVQSGVQIVGSDQSSKLQKVDLFVIAGSVQDKTNSFIIATALSQSKPILLLTDDENAEIKTISNNKSLGDLLFVVSRLKSSLKDNLAKALNQLDGTKSIELPSIKFTLRITPSQERYLQWKSQKTGLSKADFLRDKLNQLIGEDEDYRSS